jgi:CBS domain-containing membrane protein
MIIPHLVDELMSREVLSLTEDQDLQHLDETMRLFKFRHMPVTENNRLIGLVTQRDVLRISASSLLPGAREQTELLTRAYRVRDVMTRDVKVVHPGTPLTEAARTMHRDKLGCLPVVDGENRLVGILTESDFVRLALELLEGHEAESSSGQPRASS